MRTIDIIQVLRFVAALLVVIYHIAPSFGPEPDFEGIFHFIKKGGTGVDIFFVISGFIITLTAMRKQTFDTVDFTLNRFFRIYPTYWIFLSLAILLGYISYRFTGSSGTYELVQPSSLFASYTLLPIPVQIYPVAWTLTLEITFYVIFCLSFRFGGLRAVVVSLLIWYLLARLFGAQAFTEQGKLIWFFHSVVLEFLFGVLIAWLWLKGQIKFAVPVFVLGCLAYCGVVTGVFSHPDIGREFTAGIPAALLVYGAVGIKWKAPKLAVLAGDSSYILYLIHPLIITTFKIAALRLFDVNVFANNIAALMIIITSVVVSMALTHWVEAPYIRWYKGIIAKLRRAPSTGPQNG